MEPLRRVRRDHGPRAGSDAGHLGEEFGVDLFETAAQMYFRAGGETLIGPVERARNRKRRAEAGLIQVHFADEVARLAAAHLDRLRPGARDVQAYWKLRRSGGRGTVPRFNFNLYCRGVQRLDGEPAAEQRGKMRAQG